DTPERQAAFEARLGEVIASIGDDTVRKYYRREFSDRLRRLFDVDERPTARRQPLRMAAGAAKSEWRTANRGGKGPRHSSRAARYSPFALGSREPYVVASPQLVASPIHRGHRAVIPRRAALILQAAINHPPPLHDHLEHP